MTLRPFTLLSLFAAAWPIAPALAQQNDGAKVYKQTVPSVVWVHSTRDRGLATGSGTLIDKERRLVLTNYHVVQDNPNAKVFFPVFRDGQPVAEKDYYIDRARRLAIHGMVIALDKKADIALIRLDSIPDKVEAVPVAPGSPDPGSTTHTIGNAGKSGALFGYVKGTVRQVYQKEWKAELEPRKVASFSAKVVETDSPTNPGDSGGPLLNDKGELLGVTQGGAINASLVSTFIDVSEVKKLLNSKAVKDIKVNKPVVKVVREKALTVNDSAKLFSADSVTAANAALAEIFKKDIDVLIETYATAPADRLEELKKAAPADRTAYFRTWLHTRMTKEDVKGFGIIICNDPKSLYVDVTPDLLKKFPEKFELQVRDAVIKGMKDNKPDEALKEAVKLIQDQVAKGKQ
jgi:S1-C subfamily serine protease